MGLPKAVGLTAFLAGGAVLVGILALGLIISGDSGSSRVYHTGGFLLFHSFVSLFVLLIPFPWVSAGLPMKTVLKAIGWGTGWLAACSLAVYLLEALGPSGDCCMPGFRRSLISAISLAGPLLGWLVWAPLALWLYRRGLKQSLGELSPGDRETPKAG